MSVPKIGELGYFPGEAEAVAHIRKLGEQFGYGNLITHLRYAWSEMLQREHKLPQLTADRAAGHICVWCGIDSRTGKKSKGARR